MPDKQKGDIEIHTIWVGPPPASIKYQGHDTIGPELFAQHFKEQGEDKSVTFWCLDEHVAIYQKSFNGMNISVQGIESYVKAQEEPEFTDFIERLKANAHKAAIAGEEREKARELITIKDAFQYFLHLRPKSLYVMDSNIVPDTNTSLHRMPLKDKCMVPMVQKENGEFVPDPWMSFSPAEDSAAQDRFNYYFEEALEELDSRADGKIDREKLSDAFVKAPFEGRGDPVSPQMATSLDTQNYALLFYGAIKQYWNTHKKDITTSAPPVYSMLLCKQLHHALDFMLSKGFTTPNTVYSNLNALPGTLLHTAIFFNMPDELSIILKYDCDFNQSVKVPGFENKFFTPLELALTRPPAVVSTLLEGYCEQNFNGNMTFMLKTVQQLNTLLNKSPTPLASLDDLVENISDLDKPTFLESLKLVMQLGPVTTQNLSEYQQKITERRSQQESSAVHFVKSMCSLDDSQEIQAQLSQLAKQSHEATVIVRPP